VFTNIPRPKMNDWRDPRRPERGSKEASEKPNAPEKSGDDVNIRKDFREVFLWQEVPIYG